MAGELIDPLSAAGIANAAVKRALAALLDAQAARDAAVVSQNAAAAALAKVQALSKAIGVQTLWSGPNGTVLSILGPDGYGPGSDLQGREGPPGPTPRLRIGTVAEGDAAAALRDADPLNPLLDLTLPSGSDGWTPVLGLVVDGTRRVQRVVDWVGGTGAKPAAGGYVGASGLVAYLASATDLRGMPGPSAVSFVGASSTPLVIGLGAVSLVLSAATSAAYAPTLYQALVSQSDPRNAMVGVLTSYDPPSGTLSLAIQQAAGSGTHADWIVTSTPPLYVPTGIDGGYAGDPYPLPGATPVYGATAPTTGTGIDGGYA